MRKQFVVADNTQGYLVIGKTDNAEDIAVIVKSFFNSANGQGNITVEELNNGKYIKTERFNSEIDKLQTQYWFND